MCFRNLNPRRSLSCPHLQAPLLDWYQRGKVVCSSYTRYCRLSIANRSRWSRQWSVWGHKKEVQCSMPLLNWSLWRELYQGSQSSRMYHLNCRYLSWGMVGSFYPSKESCSRPYQGLYPARSQWHSGKSSTRRRWYHVCSTGRSERLKKGSIFQPHLKMEKYIPYK